MKSPATVWCSRSKHRLAWLEADGAGVVVCVAGVAPGRDRLSRGTMRVPTSDLAGYASFDVMAGCACKRRFLVDLVAVWRGEAQPVDRVTGDEFPGVSFDR